MEVPGANDPLTGPVFVVLKHLEIHFLSTWGFPVFFQNTPDFALIFLCSQVIFRICKWYVYIYIYIPTFQNQQTEDQEMILQGIYIDKQTEIYMEVSKVIGVPLGYIILF